MPPTVIREIDGKKGSCQLFVESSIDALNDVNEYQNAWFNKEGLEDQENLKIFYFVFGQWDSGPHNLLILRNKNKQHLIAIDNGGINNRQYVRYGELPFVRIAYSDKFDEDEAGKTFPFDEAEVIKEPKPEVLRAKFGAKLPNEFYDKFKSYNNPLRYVIYRQGLWRQFHADDSSFIISYSKTCSKKTKNVLEMLNYESVKKIFINSGYLFISKEEEQAYIQAILARRDQVLEKVVVRGA